MGQPRTILLVEDNPTDVFVIREVVEGCGLKLNLVVSRNGQEALEYLRRAASDVKTERPALVLLDLNLPRISGIDVLREMRDSPRYRRTPVIIVSSSTAPADRAAVEKLGVAGYFQKTAELSAYAELGALVKRALRK